MEIKREENCDRSGTIKEEHSDQLFNIKVEPKLEGKVRQIITIKEEDNDSLVEIKNEFPMEMLAQVCQRQQNDDKAAKEAMKLIISKQQFLWEILQLDNDDEYEGPHSSKEEAKMSSNNLITTATRLNAEEGYFTVNKWESFNTENLEIIIEDLRMKISKTKRKDPNLKSLKKLFWKLRHYGLSSDPRESMCAITYEPNPQFRRAIGRMYAHSTSLYSPAKQQIGLQSFPSWIRAALAGDFYWNLKITNAHPSLLLGLLDAWKVTETKFLRLTVFHREKILADIISKNGLSNHPRRKKLAEELITILFYGGSVALWRKLNELEHPLQKNDDALLDGLFNLESFATEMRDLAALLWNSGEVEKEFPYVIQIKSYCVCKFPDNSWKQKSCFLSLFLQTEERALLALIEAFMLSKNRHMDVYTHDGGLIRKLKMNDTTTENERQFPIEIIQLCEKYLGSRYPSYAYIKLKMEGFDKTSWKSKILDFSQAIPPQLNKTFEELLYYYEEKRTLCFITSENKYLWDGKLLPAKHLNLPDREYVLDVLAGETELVESESANSTSREGQVSLSQQLSLTSQNAKARNLQDFWARYSSYQHRRCFEKITFCKKETCSDHLALYKDRFSFDVLKGNPTEYLFSKMDLAHGLSLTEAECDYSIKLTLIPSFGIESPLFSDKCLPLKPDINLDKLHIGRAACFFNHMYLLCDKREEDFMKLVKFVAKMIQVPMAKEEERGLILCSEEDREGHLLAANMIKSLVSPFCRGTVRTGDIFNSSSVLQERCLLLHWTDESGEIGKQANNVKNKEFRIQKSSTNPCRFLVTTRSLKLFPFTKNDKCWTVISCSNALARNKKYYESLCEKWEIPEINRSTFLVLEAIDLSEPASKPVSKPNSKPDSKSDSDVEVLIVSPPSKTQIPTVKRFMIGISFWLKTHLNKSPFGQKFEEIYGRRIKLKASVDELFNTGTVFWISSQDLYTIFSIWCLAEPNLGDERHKYTLVKFSQLICKKIHNEEKSGIECLPIYIDLWIDKATKMGLKLQTSIIQIDSLLPILNQLNRNLPLQEFIKQE